ncbi:MAG: right-handed parallel beta-helix repeat-containing protein [Candidatus Altiarchaeota archaeon]
MNILNKWVLLTLIEVVFLIGNVNAYNSEGNGVCNCSSCTDCNSALSDNTNCYNKVKLTADIINYSGTCINNPANFSNKIFDCLGNRIDGDYSGYYFGIYLNEKQNNTIQNCIVTDFAYGINLHSSSNNTLMNNSVNSNSYGIILPYSSNNTLMYNSASLNYFGIYLISSSNNTLINNIANLNNRHGIYLDPNSNYNILNFNKFYNNNQEGGAYYDIFNQGNNLGDENSCDKAYNWNDLGTWSCSYTSDGKQRVIFSFPLIFGWNFISIPLEI